MKVELGGKIVAGSPHSLVAGVSLISVEQELSEWVFIVVHPSCGSRRVSTSDVGGFAMPPYSVRYLFAALAFLTSYFRLD